MTEKDKNLEEKLDKGGLPGDEIPGHLQEEEHHGVETIFDMADYSLSEEEKVALGIKRLDITSPLDEVEAEERARSEEPDAP
jgi:hypothetical protein